MPTIPAPSLRPEFTTPQVFIIFLICFVCLLTLIFTITCKADIIWSYITGWRRLMACDEEAGRRDTTSSSSFESDDRKVERVRMVVGNKEGGKEEMREQENMEEEGEENKVIRMVYMKRIQEQVAIVVDWEAQTIPMVRPQRSRERFIMIPILEEIDENIDPKTPPPPPPPPPPPQAH